jgi:uncharacterized protein
VIAVDSNILVYAHREDSPWYPDASRRIKELAEARAPWGIPWPCVHEFLAIVTHPRIYRPPTPLPQALNQVASWMESPSLRILGEQAGYWDLLQSTLRAGRVAGPGVHDARIVAICRQHAVDTLWSADRDVSRFAGIKVVNPLIL